MPRTNHKEPCQFCRTPIDTRGIKVHTLTCKQRPATDNVDSERTQGNLRLMLDYYREGLRDGFQFAGKQKAA